VGAVWGGFFGGDKEIWGEGLGFEFIGTKVAGGTGHDGGKIDLLDGQSHLNFAPGLDEAGGAFLGLEEFGHIFDRNPADLLNFVTVKMDRSVLGKTSSIDGIVFAFDA
jgi:hypothetical protein